MRINILAFLADQIRTLECVLFMNLERNKLSEVIQPIDVILPSEMDDVHIEMVQKGEKNPRIILLGKFYLAILRWTNCV